MMPGVTIVWIGVVGLPVLLCSAAAERTMFAEIELVNCSDSVVEAVEDCSGSDVEAVEDCVGEEGMGDWED